MRGVVATAHDCMCPLGLRMWVTVGLKPKAIEFQLNRHSCTRLASLVTLRETRHACGAHTSLRHQFVVQTSAGTTCRLGSAGEPTRTTVCLRGCPSAQTTPVLVPQRACIQSEVNLLTPLINKQMAESYFVSTLLFSLFFFFFPFRAINGNRASQRRGGAHRPPRGGNPRPPPHPRQRHHFCHRGGAGAP
jgi:hypothetical protein